MISACAFAVLLFHPSLPLAGFQSDFLNVLMGATAFLIFNSPFGRLSGAHINPAVTLAFWRLGKIKTVDAAFYVLFQFIGASAGIGLAFLFLGANRFPPRKSILPRPSPE